MMKFRHKVDTDLTMLLLTVKSLWLFFSIHRTSESEDSDSEGLNGIR